MTSAVRVGGERLYRKAHRGEEVETPQRDVEVYRAELLGRDGDTARYEIECSAGTYVRTLVETLGDAYCAELRRTAIGPFSVEDVGMEISVEQVAEMVPAVGRGAALMARSWSPRCPTPNRGRGTSRSGPSTASTAATRR